MRGKTMHKLILSICVGMLLLSEMGTSVQAATSNSLSYFYSTTSEAYAIQGYTPSDNEDLYTDKLVVPNIFQGENQGTTYTGPVVQVNASVFADHKFQYVYFENEYPLVLKEKAFQNVEVKCPENSSDSDDGSIIFCGKVKTVGAYAFNNIKLDGYLDFRGGIDTIGDYAMSNMQIKGLKSDSIRVIGKGAFSNNEITSWYGATGLETVGDNAFEYCTQLTEMSFPDTVTSIGANCFKGCTKLTKVTLPANAELTIGEAAFPDQAGLVVIIPSAITDISNYHFESLVNVVFQVEGDCSTTVIQYFEENSMQYKEGEDGEVIKGSGSSGGGNENEPSGGEEEGGNSSAENGNGSPSSGENGDGSTGNPKSDTSSQTGQPEIPQNGSNYEVKGLLYQVTGNASVTFAGVKDTTLKTIKIPTTVMIDDRMYKVTKVAGKALYKNKKVTSVTVGNNVTEIGDQAFAQCSKLKNITLGTKVEKLGKKTFYQDKKLAKLVIKSKKLKSIGKGSFKGVPKKVKISAPKAQQKKYTKLINNA